jgi:hypothetical protein
MEGASVNEMVDYSLVWVRGELHTQDEPTLVLARDIKLNELPQLGLAELSTSQAINQKYSYTVVIWQGNFDLMNTVPGTTMEDTSADLHFDHVAYVFDREGGNRVLLQAFRTGDAIHQRLTQMVDATQ